jgi:hypothetical protein
LIRIGKPLRPEFAAWRYAGEFFNRRNRSYLAAGATVTGAALASAGVGAVLGPIALAAGTISIVAAPVLTMIMVAIPLFGGAVAQDYFEYERIVARFPTSKKRVVNVRAKHMRSVEIGMYPDGDTTLNLQHDTGRVVFTGTRAVHATSVLLANSNRRGAPRRLVQSAVEQIERAGTAEGFLEAASLRNGWRGIRPRSVLNEWRGIGALSLSGTERLALEMSVHEETERRAFQGELAVLEEAWRGAEEIAEICDGQLTPVAQGLGT